MIPSIKKPFEAQHSDQTLRRLKTREPESKVWWDLLARHVERRAAFARLSPLPNKPSPDRAELIKALKIARDADQSTIPSEHLELFSKMYATYDF